MRRRPEPMGDHRGEDRSGGDVEEHHAQAGTELGGEEAGEDDLVGPLRERHEQDRRGKQDAPEDECRAHTDEPRHGRGDHRADQPAHGTGAEHEPQGSRRDVQRLRRVEDEERKEEEVEEVDRRRCKERRADNG